MSLVSIWSLIFERSNPLCCNFFFKVGCTSRKFHIVHIYHLFLFKSFLIYIVHIVHSNLQYRRKMHLKCSCLWIYRDGIWMNRRQWLDNCRGYQIFTDKITGSWPLYAVQRWWHHTARYRCHRTSHLLNTQRTCACLQQNKPVER